MFENEELGEEDLFRRMVAEAQVLPWDLNREDGRTDPQAVEHLQAQAPDRLRSALGELVAYLSMVPRLKAMDPDLARDLNNTAIPAHELALRAVRAGRPLWKYELGFLGRTADTLRGNLPEMGERTREMLVGAWKDAVDQAVPGLATRGLALNFDPSAPDYEAITAYVGIHPYPMQNPVHPDGYYDSARVFHAQFKAAQTGFNFEFGGYRLNRN